MKVTSLVLAMAGLADAQSVCNSVHKLTEDITLQSALYVDGAVPNIIGPAGNARSPCRFENGPGFMRRLMDLPSGKTFGYEVHVSRNAPGKKPYHVRVTPVQGSNATMYFPRGPEPVDVDSSETIEFALFVLESSQGTARLIERLQVTRETPRLYNSPLQALVPSGTPISLTKPTLQAQNSKYSSPLTSTGTVRGDNVWFYIPGLGRVWLTSVRQPGFETTVPIKGNQLEFRWDGLDYVLSTTGPMIDLPGEWSVWLRLERDWRTAAPWKRENGLVMGATAR